MVIAFSRMVCLLERAFFGLAWERRASGSETDTSFSGRHRANADGSVGFLGLVASMMAGQGLPRVRNMGM